MKFIAPMMASQLPVPFNPKPGEYVAEEKFDGHRLVVRVEDGKVRGWSRAEIERILPKHIREALIALPDGCYDGELLVPGKRSYGVTVIEDAAKLVFTVFDVLELVGLSTVHEGYDRRRSYLEAIFNALEVKPGLKLATVVHISSMDDVKLAAATVWARDGEGLIIKRRDAAYEVGKRSKQWFKVKQLRSAVLTVTGFSAGRLGPQATIRLRDDDGNETTVKALNNKTLAQLGADPASFIGRRLMIEYQERTPDGSYRHPRWDRWENE